MESKLILRRFNQDFFLWLTKKHQNLKLRPLLTLKTPKTTVMVVAMMVELRADQV